MTIVNNSAPFTSFGQLKVGETFIDPNDGGIMMKINPRTCEDKTNCVSLEDGEGYNFDACYEVFLLTKVTLTIN